MELFTSSMLPKGAVHLTLSGINRVAQKLGIDYAPAMKGWEFTKGACYPMYVEGIASIVMKKFLVLMVLLLPVNMKIS